MSRILVLGYELPTLAEGAVEARSYRTWQFVEPLLADDHQVCLVINGQSGRFDATHPLGPLLSYHQVAMQRPGWPSRLNRLHDQFKPDGVLAVMFNNCLRVTRLVTERPIWMDIYGDKLAEAQIGSYFRQSSRGFRNMFRYLREVLTQGDVYSTCSTPQKYSLVGQLGMVSRLNRHTLGYEFVYPVLPGAPACPRDTNSGPTLRGDLVPTDAFVVLWCGGYNVWTDVDTLFQALDEAMSRDPRVFFVSVGGSVKIGQNNAYDRLLAMIETSAHRHRFHVLGWRPAGEIPAYYRQAEVGISLDALHYETLLGTRTRLVEMMRHGLPVITSVGCELSAIIHDQELGLTFPIGDAAALRDRILALAGDPTGRQILAERAQRYVAHQLSFSETTRPFREWARRPYHAPDRVETGRRCSLQEIEPYLRSVARGILWRLWALERAD
jgi:glycosyltransferase involved in cell wall biosynthesis